MIAAARQQAGEQKQLSGDIQRGEKQAQEIASLANEAEKDILMRPRKFNTPVSGFLAFAFLFAGGIISASSTFKSASYCTNAVGEGVPIFLIFIALTAACIVTLLKVKSNITKNISSVILMAYVMACYANMTYASRLMMSCAHEDNKNAKKIHEGLTTTSNMLTVIGSTLALQYIFEARTIITILAGFISHLYICISTQIFPFHTLKPQCGQVSAERTKQCMQELGSRAMKEKLQDLSGAKDEEGVSCENRVRYAASSAITAALFTKNGDPQSYFADSEKLNQTYKPRMSTEERAAARVKEMSERRDRSIKIKYNIK